MTDPRGPTRIYPPGRARRAGRGRGVSDPCGCLCCEGRGMTDGNMTVGAGPRHATTRGGPSAQGRGSGAGRGGSAGSTVRPWVCASIAARRSLSLPLDLDPQQRAVVEHRDGHLLVLAGPGTGKTATLAELVVARIADPVDPIPADRILALTFGRRAARELSDRISGRLGGGAVPVVSTFHSFAYGVLRQHADPTAFASPPRLLVAAEQDARLRELLTYSIEEGRLQWPESLSRAVGTRGIAEQVRALLARARGQGLDGKDLVPDRPARGRARVGSARRLLRGVPRHPRVRGQPRLRRADPARGRAGQRPARGAGAARGVPAHRGRRVPGHRPGPGRAAEGACRWRRPGRGCGRPRPGDLRLPRRRRARHPALPGRVRRADRPTCPDRGAAHDATVPDGHRAGGVGGARAGVVGSAAGRGPAAAPDAGGPGRSGAGRGADVPERGRGGRGRGGDAAARARRGVGVRGGVGTSRGESGRVAGPGGSGRAAFAGTPDALGSRGRRWRSSCAIPPCTVRSWRVPCGLPGSPCGCLRTRPRLPTNPRSASCCRSSVWPSTHRRRRRRPAGHCWPGLSGGPTRLRSGRWPGRCSGSIVVRWSGGPVRCRCGPVAVRGGWRGAQTRRRSAPRPPTPC